MVYYIGVKAELYRWCDSSLVENGDDLCSHFPHSSSPCPVWQRVSDSQVSWMPIFVNLPSIWFLFRGCTSSCPVLPRSQPRAPGNTAWRASPSWPRRCSMRRTWWRHAIPGTDGTWHVPPSSEVSHDKLGFPSPEFIGRRPLAIPGLIILIPTLPLLICNGRTLTGHIRNTLTEQRYEKKGYR